MKFLLLAKKALKYKRMRLPLYERIPIENGAGATAEELVAAMMGRGEEPLVSGRLPRPEVKTGGGMEDKLEKIASRFAS